ncbi:SDR family oxidoreductase [Nocardia huaxiensis]|uniref:SDR family oxidoreductase n=1 Tax=Nocardia huaxiensis TaxID=2755382 RepID=UPI001E57BBD0|nr:SDR family oxidoreductase [Nocardia huaxiensis]UFS98534.1 SDR family oxidoreductase [Nocardia huaxiensis]
MSTHPVQGSLVAITGGARGIGLATAQYLIRLGARVAIGDIDKDAAFGVSEALGGHAHGFALDVTDRDSFTNFLQQAQDTFGPLSVLINNAGIMPIGPFLGQRVDIQDRAVDINLHGVLNGMRLALPGMIERQRGHIINVASTAGKAPVPGGLVYGATKAAVASLTETARVEFGGTGVEFTCVLPSFTNTELIAGTKGLKGFRTIEPEDVAHAIGDAIRKPEPEKYVPAIVGTTLAVQPLIPRSARDRINRALGGYDTFLDVDQAARHGYDERIGGN